MTDLEILRLLRKQMDLIEVQDEILTKMVDVLEQQVCEVSLLEARVLMLESEEA